MLMSGQAAFRCGMLSAGIDVQDFPGFIEFNYEANVEASAAAPPPVLANTTNQKESSPSAPIAKAKKLANKLHVLASQKRVPEVRPSPAPASV